MAVGGELALWCVMVVACDGGGGATRSFTINVMVVVCDCNDGGHGVGGGTAFRLSSRLFASFAREAL